jgi:carboxyl-terminal processing protease
MKRHSVNAGKVNWHKIKKTATLKAAGINNPYQLGPVMRCLFQSVNDFHGQFGYKDSAFRWTNAAPEISDSIMNEWKKGVTIQTLILPDNIGYLRVPPMPYRGKDDADQQAQKLNDSLCYLLGQHVRGIVLDLRLDAGGAMYPMILGLKQLIDTGYLGSFTANNEKWYVRENNFLLDTLILASIHRTCNIDARMVPVVILIGHGTQSSGEFLLMALKPRKKTVLLGSSTGGYVTSNAGFNIDDEAYILIATGYGVDRNGQVYKEALKPDIVMEVPDSFNDIQNDLKVNAALQWFNKELR